MKKLLWLDVETTGLDPKVNDIIQVAGIIEINGERKADFNFYCQPFNWVKISKRALAMQKKTMGDLKGYNTPDIIYNHLLALFDNYIDKYVKTDVFTPAGHNVWFDIRFLHQFFRKNHNQYFWSYITRKAIDLKPMAMRYKKAGKINPKNFKLETLAKEFNLELNPHDAMSDIIVTREIIKIIQGER